MSTPNPFFPDNIRDLLNNMNPAAARAALGDIIVELQKKAGESSGGDLAAVVANLETQVQTLQATVADLSTRLSAAEDAIAGGGA